jgi:N-sulfoglucosamine sulfohydrolase
VHRGEREVAGEWPHVPWPKESKIVEKDLPPKLVDTPETREARSRYLEAVAHCDRDLGLVYDAAKKHLGDDLIFAFTSDHGSQFPFGKWNCYDEGVRTPLFVVAPKFVKAGTSTGAFVSWIDLLPTFLAEAGGKPPETLSGKSFGEVLRGTKDQHREKVFLTHSSDGKMNIYPIRAVRTKDWKYIRNLDPTAEHHTHVNKGNAGTDGRNYWDSWAKLAMTDEKAAAVVKRYHTRPAEELYDIANDPWELKNLASDASQTERLKLLRADLDAWMRTNGDEGLAIEQALQKAKKK